MVNLPPPLGENCVKNQQNVQKVEINDWLTTQICPTHHPPHSPLALHFIALIVDIPIRLVVLFALYLKSLKLRVCALKDAKKAQP